jgi:hypothetical protein
MKNKLLWLAAEIGALVLVAVLGATAQTPTIFSGVFNDYTPASVGGPWEVRGQWLLTVNGDSGTANFSAVVTMERSDLGVIQNGGGDLNNPAARSAHTHHITVVSGAVTPLANGFRVAGAATITGNGNYPPPFGGNSTVQIDVTGGNTVAFSNVKLSFVGDASGHFGSQPVNGVVRNFK